MKEIRLPRREGGRMEQQLALCTRQLIVVGANGAGKTRFVEAMSSDLGNRAYRLSALDALFVADKEGKTDLDRVVAKLLHDEIENLIRYKVERATGKHDTALSRTKLDVLIEMWQEVYPASSMLVGGDGLTFKRDGYDDSYGTSHLSDGERVVLYIIGKMLYAPREAVVIIDSPEMFLHPSIMQSLWNRIEQMRTDCMMVYTTHDLEFAASRQRASIVWVKSYDSAQEAWDYDIMPPGSPLGEEIYMAIMGARKPVLFIEGDGVRSIDARLYPLVFKDYTVKSLGSCNKVIEATRTFNDLSSFHHLASTGIVDRDRRDEGEVEYLKRKNIMVPSVAEIENILLLEEVIRATAAARGFNENQVAKKVKASIIKMFEREYRQQALMHTRHKVKRTVEYRVDGRFETIGQLEEHMAGLIDEIAPRRLYENYCREFRRYIDCGDYDAVLRVFNRKSMLSACNVAGLIGLKGRDAYISHILKILRENGDAARRIRSAIHQCFGVAQ